MKSLFIIPPVNKKSSVLTVTLVILILIIESVNLVFAQPDEDQLISINNNGRYFIDRNGKPFFWQGDTEWELLHLFSVNDAKEFLLERKRQGFNVIQVVVNGVFPEWGKSQGMKPWNDMQAWKNNNPLTPNEDYFARADSIISFARDEGIILVLGVYHARDEDAKRITLKNAEPWARWLASRYKDFDNIIWSMYPHAVPASEPVIRATVKGIRKGDGGVHMITMHPDPSPASSSFMHNESWLSFNTLQTWSTDLKNYNMVQDDYRKTPVKPVVDGEARYETEDGTTPFETRRAGYWAYLAGGFYSYGHGDNWKSPQTWCDWVDAPGTRQITIMGNLFRSISWWTLIPDQSVFVNVVPGNVAARSSDGSWIMAYITDPDSCAIRLNTLVPTRRISCRWIDPASGYNIVVGTFRKTDDRTFILPEGWKDGVLVIEKFR